jgi:protein required for attachment to host cells
MLLPNATTIAVADGGKFVLYRNAGTEIRPRLAALPEPKIEGHSKEAGKRHHVSTANPGKSRLEEDSFAAAAAEWLSHQAVEGKIEHLVVIADPRTLGELRRHYHKAVTDRLMAEVPKDLTGEPADEVLATLLRHEAA